MPTENTSLKNITPAGDSNSANEMVIGKVNTYQRSCLIVAGSLLALLVLIAVAGTSGGQHSQLSTYEITEGGVSLADYLVDSANLALTKDIFRMSANSGDGRICGLGIFTGQCSCGGTCVPKCSNVSGCWSWDQCSNGCSYCCSKGKCIMQCSV